ncbi:MAG: hypothetical protein HY319_15155 [Armatimonadetes bacterium]|nr:hypothetical protein [Armatimonadota bacterium]
MTIRIDDLPLNIEAGELGSIRGGFFEDFVIRGNCGQDQNRPDDGLGLV